MRGKTDPLLEYPELPPLFRLTMEQFNELGAELTYQEVAAYMSVTGVSISDTGIGLIKDIGYVMKAVQAGRTTKQVLEAFNYG